MTHAEFTLQHLLFNSAKRAPGHVAIVDGASSYTYLQLLGQSSQLAARLRALGVKRGDRVGVYLEKRWEAIVAMLGIGQAGAVFVNINPLLKTTQVEHIMGDCQVRVLVGEADRLQSGKFPQVDLALHVGDLSGTLPWARHTVPFLDKSAPASDTPPQTMSKGSDIATIIYTSGSTGRPKGIMLTHANVVAGAQIVSTYLKNTPEDRVLSVLPLSFDAGLNQFTTMLRVGGTLVLQRSLLPGDILRNLRKERITGLAGVPPVWALLLSARRSLEKEPLTTLRYISNTGGMVPGPHLASLRELLKGTDIYLMYGLTEAFRSTYLEPDQVHRGASCIGKAIPNTDIWVVDQHGRETAPDETGELIHRGPTVALGYWGDPEKTSAVYRPNPFAPPETLGRDIVVYSGDLVKRDAEGFLYFIGRRDEQIKTEGYRVSPQEVEELLCSIPGVHEAAAFGKKDDLLGHLVVAVVSAKEGASPTADDLRRQCSEKAPHYLVPREIHILSELPKTPTGKIDRTSLRNEYATVKS